MLVLSARSSNGLDRKNRGPGVMSLSLSELIIAGLTIRGNA